MRPVVFATLLSLASALPASLVNDNTGRAVSKLDHENAAFVCSDADLRRDSEILHTLNTREVYFSQPYDWPESELIVHAYGRAAFFYVAPKDGTTYNVRFQNLGPANGRSYKFVFTVSGNDDITDVLAGGGTLSQVYEVTGSDSQFKIEVSDP